MNKPAWANEVCPPYGLAFHGRRSGNFRPIEAKSRLASLAKKAKGWRCAPPFRGFAVDFKASEATRAFAVVGRRRKR